jgi:hypothetical protein
MLYIHLLFRQFKSYQLITTMKSILTIGLTVLLIAVSAPFSILHAQQSEVTVEELRDITRGSAVTVQRQHTDVAGSPYLFDSFVDGYVTLSNGLVTEKLTMNYNIYENRIEYSDGNSILAIENHRMKNFIFERNGDREIFKRGFDARGLERDEFVRLLSEGKVTAFLKYETSFQEIPSYGQATRRSEFITNKRLYVKKDGETDRIRRLSERNVVRSLDTHRDEMREFARQGNLDLENADDLRKFFAHYNKIAE